MRAPPTTPRHVNSPFHSYCQKCRSNSNPQHASTSTRQLMFKSIVSAVTGAGSHTVSNPQHHPPFLTSCHTRSAAKQITSCMHARRSYCQLASGNPQERALAQAQTILALLKTSVWQLLQRPRSHKLAPRFHQQASSLCSCNHACHTRCCASTADTLLSCI
jgi:hypothetical protein